MKTVHWWMPAFYTVRQAKHAGLSPAQFWHLLILLVLGGSSGDGSVVVHLDKDSHLSILINKMITSHYSSHFCKIDRDLSVCLGTHQEIKLTYPLP